ncbi:MAG TPA: hypothetical protein VM325_01330 [Alphaproteobacteria bacterium]|nr:hypothetical protein [Alphaproteobacteria bacterium]
MTDMNAIVDEAMKKMKAAADLSEAQEAALREVVVKAVIAASETTSKTCAEVARSHKKLDPGSANRVSSDIEGSIVALIANLEAMR